MDCADYDLDLPPMALRATAPAITSVTATASTKPAVQKPTYSNDLEKPPELRHP